jgi:hypothetical protein
MGASSAAIPSFLLSFLGWSGAAHGSLGDISPFDAWANPTGN